MNLKQNSQPGFNLLYKKQPSVSLRQKQKGQALVEYIILLVLVVGVTVGLMREVSDKMKEKLRDTKERINKFVP